MDTKKIFVGLSGGVDSATSAALLKATRLPDGSQGFDVTGVFIKGWQPEFLDCPSAEDRAEALRAATHLGIAFETLDLSEKYEKEVGEYLISEYKKGRTPNPDVLCNRVIKFGAFFDWAIEKGAEYVATGHYARIVKPEAWSVEREKKLQATSFKLQVSADKQKDQTYFLWMLAQRELSKTIFPVGEYEKEDVRKLAEKFGLPNARRKDSQGLCFLGKLDMREFLKRFVPVEPGKVLDTSGNVIGEHEGAALYTIGQRHGFTAQVKGTQSRPHYVVHTNVTDNTIVVTENPEEMGVKEIRLENANWISDIPEKEKRYEGRTRYRQPLVPCTVEVSAGEATIRFEKPVIAAPGQSCVIYDGDICMGGGIIQ